jgi:hypothetical protein
MVVKITKVPFSTFLYDTLAGHAIFGIPTVVAIIAFSLLGKEPLFFIFLPIALVSIPLSATLSWLIAKGSNWINTPAAIIATCSVPGRFYAVLFGGLLGFRVFNTIGGILLAILLYVGAMLITVPLGKFLLGRLAPELILQKDK